MSGVLPCDDAFDQHPETRYKPSDARSDGKAKWAFAG
jgi:hypothetical protein